MIRIRLFLVVVIACVLFKQYEEPSKPNPQVDPANTVAVALFTYDIDSPPPLVGSRDLRDWMDQHGVSWRFTGSNQKFGDDLPEFKKLMDQPRKADNWLYVHGGLLRGDDSVPMPADEAAAEKVIGKHAR